MNAVDGNKGIFVDVEDELFQVFNVKACHDRVENFFRLSRVAAGTMEQGDACMQFLADGLANLCVVIGDDEDGVGLAQTFKNDINHLGDDEICDERIHRTIPSEEKAGRGKDEEVDEHHDFTNRENGFFVEDNSDDFRSVEGTTCADDEAAAKAADDATEDGSEKRIFRDALHGREEGREERQQAHGDNDGNGKLFPNLPIAKLEERQVQQNQKGAEAHVCDGVQHDRDADNATVNDVVRNQKEFQADGCNQSTERAGCVFQGKGAKRPWLTRKNHFVSLLAV